MKPIAVAIPYATTVWLSVIACSSSFTEHSKEPLAADADAAPAGRAGSGGGGATTGAGATATGSTTSGKGGATGGSGKTGAKGGTTSGGATTGSGGTTSGSGGASNGGTMMGSGGTTTGSGGTSSGGTMSGSGGASNGGTMTGSGGGTGSGGATSSGAYVRQYTENSQVGIGSQDISSTLSKPVLAGSTILIFATEYNIGGQPPGSAPPDPIAIDDSAKGVYTHLQTVNSEPDWQAVLSYARYNVAAGNITVHAHFAGLEWQGIVAVEVANVSASPLIASVGKFNGATKGQPNAATSGTMALGSSPALVVALGVSCSDANGAPSVGTGFTAVGKAWNWAGAEGSSTLPSSILEYGRFDNPGTLAATFTPVAANEKFCVLAMGLKG